MHPQAFARKQPLLHKLLVVLFGQIQANHFDTLLSHFVIYAESIRKEMLHSEGQITFATKQLHTEKTMSPKFGPHIVCCIDMFTIQYLGLTFFSM